jgi:hypothetical protein
MASCETEVLGCKLFNLMHEHLNFAQLFEIVALSSDKPIQRVWPAFRYSSGGFEGYFLRHVSSLKQLRTKNVRWPLHRTKSARANQREVPRYYEALFERCRCESLYTPEIDACWWLHSPKCS